MADFWGKVIFDRNGRIKIYKSYKLYDRFNNGISDGVKIQVRNKLKNYNYLTYRKNNYTILTYFIFTLRDNK